MVCFNVPAPLEALWLIRQGANNYQYPPFCTHIKWTTGHEWLSLPSD